MELFVVVLVCLLATIAWFAVWMEGRTLIDGLKIAIGLPVMIVTVGSLFVYIVHCFKVVVLG